jgi:hypothetical protein
MGGQVHANLERGWPADWIDRKYIPPDWSEVYRLIGGPPVGSTEMQAYNDLLNAFTQMLEPRDEMELTMEELAPYYAGLAQLFRLLRNARGVDRSHSLGPAAITGRPVASVENTASPSCGTDRTAGL